MSGHSKWSSIKHKKAATDAKRGKVFTRFIRELTIAARAGGGDPESNSRLRHAMEGARAANMPSDNIKKAVQRGTGELEGVNYEEFSYEGYGPGGVAILADAMTDNKNRTVSEVRHVFEKYNGNLGQQGCVSWMFTRKGLIVVPQSAIGEDELMEIVLDSGAEDMKKEGENFEITTSTEDFDTVHEALKAKKLPIESAEIAKVPSTYIKLEGKQAEQMLKLYDRLEELDDIQNVWANFDIADEVIDQFNKG
ncbi:MAG: YebC/PmpR family DNA-binding transcriptional regulator [Candidatus Aminicenantes bacterium]|nr:YebC/PmpR family DNA-binding transcriptional regulator [Candidatus Aminicenantes bacterium]